MNLKLDAKLAQKITFPSVHAFQRERERKRERERERERERIGLVRLG